MRETIRPDRSIWRRRCAMTLQKITPGARRFLTFVVLLDLSLLATIGAICWFGGWRTAWDFGNGLTYAGLAIMLVGGLQYFGSFSRAADPIAGYRSTNLADQAGWVRRAIGERDSAFAT